MDAYALSAAGRIRRRAASTSIRSFRTCFAEAGASSVFGKELNRKGFGLITSLEASYRFDLAGGWAIEP
ncbi:MAG: hypothetical protein K0S00_564 [Xanthobacteraceae bacterium]|jgi:hypothetical protein|nr:hypothetical protein [Xanthobacteraceae bacterium]